MPLLPRELHRTLINPQIAAQVVDVAVAVNIDGTATRTVPIYVATRDVKVVEASVAHESEPDGEKTYKIRNITSEDDVTGEADANGVAANTAISLDVTSDNDRVDEDDVLALVYDVSTAGSDAPDVVVVTLKLQLLD